MELGRFVHAERLHRVEDAALSAREQFGEKAFIFFQTQLIRNVFIYKN
jgi:hypothetical protein